MTPRGAGALTGTRVLDLTSVVMGPMATQILGDLGADVISVESAHPDTNRAMGPGPHRYLSGVSLNLLRSKRNIAVDLKTDAGREVLRRLVASCDVFVTNLRPGPLARMKMRYEDVAAIRPDVIYCQAQGFPSDSERADDPAYDDIIQSATGVADATRRAYGEPALVPSIFADKVAGMTVLYSILAALVHRERTGEGQRIEVAMTEAVKAFMLVEHGSAAVPVPPLGPAGYQRVITPERRPQRTADGWINVLPYSKAQYDAIFTAGGRDDLLGDERYADGRSRVANSDFLYQQVRGIMLQRTTAEWLEFCRRTEIPASPVVTLEEIVAEQPVASHPLVGDYHQVRPGARMSATPMRAQRPAPLPGQDNDEVLLELGYSPEEVKELAERGVLRSVGADGKLS
jgi:crotonobetainyl-CoA:carnitine CoA-transferase CaiB-like acyl-CoA transferase